MEYQTRTQNSVTILELKGDLDVDGAPRFQKAVEDIVDAGGRKIVVDLSQTPFMDSSGLGVLVAAHRRISAAGGSLALAQPTPILQKVFELTRTHRVFNMYDSVNSAIQAMERE